MGKKSIIAIVTVLALAVLGVGSYALLHKPSKVVAPGVKSETSANSTSSEVVQTKTDSKIGSYLATSNGIPLYVYEKDTVGVSNCSGSCLGAWPAYAPTSTAATLPAGVTAITRTDGAMQYAYNGMPLYIFVSDSIGTVTGNGVSGFAIARP
jgi:predicted lipoprotein with Yx(FWY)xxD motif